MITGRDLGDELTAAVARARAERVAVFITGSGSKSFLTTSPVRETPPDAGVPDGRLLSTVEHSGIVDYQPDELVVTVRAGTPLRELAQDLAQADQMLPFDPPSYRRLGTVGGAVAAGLSGPGRPWRGSVRDALLGVEMVNGLGERLRFGGQVMKNVAGYDLSRLQAGAFGSFGLLLSVSLRVLPRPAAEATLSFEMRAADALALMRGWARTPLPISATCWMDGELFVRLSGADAAVRFASAVLGGEPQTDVGFWNGLRDHESAFFKTGGVGLTLVPPATPVGAETGVIEWSGARRWVKADGETPSLPFGAGYAYTVCQLGGGDVLLGTYQRRLKAAFDPDNLFNPGICHADSAA